MIAVVFALEFESAGFLARQKQRLCVSVWTLGAMGAHSAEALRSHLQRNHPDLVVSAGFSGALIPDLPVGSIVLGENYTDPQLAARLSLPPGVRAGKLACVEQILETREAKARVAAQTGAMAADLESAHLHDVCQRAGIGMLSLRCISDTLSQTLPIPGDVLMNPATGRTDPQAIFRFLFRHPGRAPDFARLVRDAKTAQTALATALEALLPALLHPADQKES